MNNEELIMDPASQGISRRKFLGLAWLASLGLLALGIMGAGLKYLIPQVKQGEFGAAFNLGPVSAIPAKGDPPLNHPKGRFWLVHGDQGLRAFYKACTHLDCQFNWNPQEKKFICPCHGSQFGTDGTVLSGPAPRDLDQFVVRVIGPKGELIAETGQDGMEAIRLIAPKAETAGSAQGPEQPRAWSLATAKEALMLPPKTRIWVDTGRKLTGREARIG